MRVVATERADERSFYDVSSKHPLSKTSTKSCRAVSRSTMRIGPPQRGQGQVRARADTVGVSTDKGADWTARVWRQWARS